MSKTSVALIIILFFFIACFLLIALSPSASMLTNLAHFNRQSPSANETMQTTIGFETNKSQITTGQVATVDVTIDTEAELALAQLEIGYDPLVITILAVDPGDFFIKPQETLKTINPNNGRISYVITCSVAAGESCIASQEKKLATITYTTAQPLTQQTELSIMPKTLVRVENDNQEVIRGNDLTIDITGLSTESASSSATPPLTEETN